MYLWKHVIYVFGRSSLRTDAWNEERPHFPEACPSTAPNSLHVLHLPARAQAGGGDTLMTRVREAAAAAAAAAASCLTKQQQHRRNTEQVSRS